jgi:hypothetical protein
MATSNGKISPSLPTLIVLGKFHKSRIKVGKDYRKSFQIQSYLMEGYNLKMPFKVHLGIVIFYQLYRL